MMKRISLFLLTVLTIIFCCACGSETSGKAKEENLSELVTVTEEYFYVDSIGQGEYVVIVKNNSSKTVNATVNAIAKDASGQTIGASSATLSTIASGAEACIRNLFQGVSEAVDFECTLSVEEDTWYDPVTQDLTFEQSLVGDKVIVTCTNNGEEAVENLDVVALFFREGEFVYYGINWSQEIEAGATVSTEVRSFESYTQEMTYDEAKVYLSGWR